MSSTAGKPLARLGLAGLLVVATLAGACSPINRFHGFTPSPAELSQVQVGQTTRDSVVESFGPPTSKGVQGEDAYFYVSSQFRHLGAFAPEEVERKIVAVSFTPQGIVSNVERFSLADGRVVVLDRRVTDDGIKNVSALSQLFGSLGRIDAGTLLGEQDSGL